MNLVAHWYEERTQRVPEMSTVGPWTVVKCQRS